MLRVTERGLQPKGFVGDSADGRNWEATGGENQVLKTEEGTCPCQAAGARGRLMLNVGKE